MATVVGEDSAKEVHMIISASRRTDIPAIYSRWLMNRIRTGWCVVTNPVNTKQVSWVSLSPDDVDGIVFWSKNPTPMLEHLDELDALRFTYYFQFTLNDYPRVLEPHIPSLNERLATFLKLSERLGSIRVIWRYDPIIISNTTPYSFHSDRFAKIAERLEGATRRVMVSVVDYYRKTDRRLSSLERRGFSFDREAASSPNMARLMTDLAETTIRYGMDIYTCSEERDFSHYGVPPGRCIDDRLLSKLLPTLISYPKDPSQRKFCLCVVSKDIGMNDTCIHGCPYCYSTKNYALAKRRHSEHDPNSPALWGRPEIPAEPQKVARGQMNLF